LTSTYSETSNSVDAFRLSIQPNFSNVIQNSVSFNPEDLHVIGVLQGEGVGPEVVTVALELLHVLQEHTARRFLISQGGLIGSPAVERFGTSLSDEVIDFTQRVFAKNGALFCGPGGERFVYEMRRKFDLYCKFTPIKPMPELRDAGVVRAHATQIADIIAVRENLGGIYQGEWSVNTNPAGEVRAQHTFAYTDTMVRRILEASFRLAQTRRKRLHVVLKPGGIPSISSLWRDVANEMSKDFDVTLFEFEIDNAVYQLIADPGQFDVLVSPNMFGDVLADCGSLLLASRGVSYSGNFNSDRNGVYQTGHGAARDIAGKGIANPIGQILTLGMMLRESFDWPEADAMLRMAVQKTLRNGAFTRDIAPPGGTIVNTATFGAFVKGALREELSGRIL
jgi:3-isopropylmalate dehydrogenase